MVIDQQVYDEQMEIQHRVRDRYPTNDHENNKERCLQLMVEVVEVLNHFEWKPHRHDYSREVDYNEVADELVDVYKFFLNLLIINGISPKTFEVHYAKKHAIVLERLEAEGL